MNTSGPYCPYCQNAAMEYREDPDAFDIHEHVKRCAARRLPTAAKLIESHPAPRQTLTD